MTALWQLAIEDAILKQPLAKAGSSTVQGHKAVDWWYSTSNPTEIRMAERR
jgi:hypothetical protein